MKKQIYALIVMAMVISGLQAAAPMSPPTPPGPMHTQMPGAQAVTQGSVGTPIRQQPPLIGPNNGPASVMVK